MLPELPATSQRVLYLAQPPEHNWHNPRNIILVQVKCMPCPNLRPYKEVYRIVQLGPNELLTNQMTRQNASGTVQTAENVYRSVHFCSAWPQPGNPTTLQGCNFYFYNGLQIMFCCNITNIYKTYLK